MLSVRVPVLRRIVMAAPVGIRKRIRTLCPGVPWIADIAAVRTFFEALFGDLGARLPTDLSSGDLHVFPIAEAHEEVAWRIDRDAKRIGGSIHACYQTAMNEILLRARNAPITGLARKSQNALTVCVAGLLCYARDAGRANPMC